VLSVSSKSVDIVLLETSALRLMSVTTETYVPLSFPTYMEFKANLFPVFRYSVLSVSSKSVDIVLLETSALRPMSVTTETYVPLSFSTYMEFQANLLPVFRYSVLSAF